VEFAWAPIGKPVTNDQIYDNTITASKVVTGDPAKTTPAERGGFFDEMGPLLLGGLAAASLYGANKKYGILDGLFGTEEDNSTWDYDDGSYDDWNYTTWSDIQEPEYGDTVNYYYDATPYQPDPYSYFQDVGFSDYGYGDDDGSFFGDWF